jgi:polyhydroxyalkanoate synthesis repressor PhaR
MPIIKRYNNRKLYDTSSKRYISLDDIAEMVRAGEEVRIIDHDSGGDITTLTLFQILFEEEKRIGGLMPQIFLTRLIRSGSEALNQAKKSFTKTAPLMASPAETDLEIERRIQNLVLSGDISPEEGARMLEMLVPPIPEPELAVDSEHSQPETPEPAATSSLIGELLDQLDRLEAELEEIRQVR